MPESSRPQQTGSELSGRARRCGTTEIRGADHSVHLQEGRTHEVWLRNQRVQRPAAQQAAERIAVQMRAEEED